ncbi:AAA family ATPase [Nostocoides sp. F2B08]|uniref:AAA family ATPase n=1 Tax=Nostocoides sp. F2B08 TaxID=2653936 RepID=UPI0012638C99|nr:AAA family ATPase [Tetrasphaera sp. F2B08]KAB7746289.1 AAA family ATPase [Tetrasphaera sp. F2B08]
MISTLAVSGYRSLREVVVGLGRLTVVTGPNGSGKSSLYRSLRLLGDCAQGHVVGSLAREGGLQSALWAGPETLSGARRGHDVEGTRRRGPVSLLLGFSTQPGHESSGSDPAAGFGYLVDLGLPVPQESSAFNRDPQVKRELIWSGPTARPGAILVQRRGGTVATRDGRGWSDLVTGLSSAASLMTEVADPHRAPEVLSVRDRIRSWRFYDGFRTDVDAPVRRPQVGTRTDVLAGDGGDLAAAIQTIQEIGDGAALHDSVADAFDGARVAVLWDGGLCEVALHQRGMLRPLRSGELSDGTIRYLALIAALHTPRPPTLMVLNEPETSLHPNLVPALARLITRAARDTQVVVVTHSAPLVEALDDAGRDTLRDDIRSVSLVKDLGETRIEGQGLLTTPQWHWGSR